MVCVRSDISGMGGLSIFRPLLMGGLSVRYQIFREWVGLDIAGMGWFVGQLDQIFREWVGLSVRLDI